MGVQISQRSKVNQPKQGHQPWQSNSLLGVCVYIVDARCPAHSEAWTKSDAGLCRFWVMKFLRFRICWVQKCLSSWIVPRFS